MSKTVDDDHLFGRFQQFRPHGQGVEKVFVGVPKAAEYVSRLLAVCSATSDAACANDAYFVARRWR
ncbi:MAG: hypothetical protein HYS13_10275 [Planctomycetia bacterium]|nr:hypothetical protein [Planctomycetia bacterium]